MKTLGIDIGGTRIKYGIVDNGRLLCLNAVDTPSGSYGSVLMVLKEISDNMTAEHPDIGRIGMAVPGIIDPLTGIVRYSNNLGWNEEPLLADMEAHTGIPVRMANDAQCAALGEALHGAGRGYSRVAMFTVGTGVGGGFIINGKPETDLHGAMAYIFGHGVLTYGGRPCNCGRMGCLEAYCSAPALLKDAREAGIPIDSVKELFERARSGEATAKSVITRFTEMLGSGVADIGNILRPQVIILGGGVSDSSDMILPGIQDKLKKQVYGFAFAPIHVVRAALGNAAGIIGAASL